MAVFKTLEASAAITALHWDPSGGRLLLGGKTISMWCDKVRANGACAVPCRASLQRIMLSGLTIAQAFGEEEVITIAEETADVHIVHGNYVPIWGRGLSQPVQHCQFSPGEPGCTCWKQEKEEAGA